MANFMDDISDIDLEGADIGNESENSYLNQSFGEDHQTQDQGDPTSNISPQLASNNFSSLENGNQESQVNQSAASTTPVNTMRVDQQQSQCHQREETLEAGAMNATPAATSLLEQALNISSDDSGCELGNLDGQADRQQQKLDQFEFGEDDDFFADLPPIVQEQTSLLASKPSETTTQDGGLTQAAEPLKQEAIRKDEPLKRDRLQLTKADLRRKDVPLFDCIFCVENSGLVMKGMIQKSLVSKFFESCREISGNEQIPVQLSRIETMVKYDPDRVQSYLGGSQKENDVEPFNLKMLATTIKKEFLHSSLWLGQQRLLPAKHEKVFEQRFKQVPRSFKRKVTTPLIRTRSMKQQQLLNRSHHSLFYRRAMYAANKPTIGDNTEAKEEVKDSDAPKGVQGGLNLAELEEEEFSGKVTVTNWAITHKQKIYRDISFDSVVHDIYNPQFSSDEEASISEEESQAKICDERLSQLNPCSDDEDSLQKFDSFSSDKTELERCQAAESENLHDDDIRESLIVKDRNFFGSVILDNHAMETPQLSDISSFNPNDPQVRQIDLDSSSLSGSGDLRRRLHSKGSSSAQKKLTTESDQQNVSGAKHAHLLNYSAQKDQSDEEVSSELSVAEEVIAGPRAVEQSLSQVFGNPITTTEGNTVDQKGDVSAKGTEQSFIKGKPMQFLNNTWMQIGGDQNGEELTEFKATDFVTGEETKFTRETPLPKVMKSSHTSTPQPEFQLLGNNIYNTGACQAKTGYLIGDQGSTLVARLVFGGAQAAPYRPLRPFNVVGQPGGDQKFHQFVSQVTMNNSVSLNESSLSKTRQSNRSIIVSQGSSATERQLFKNPFQTFSLHSQLKNNDRSFQGVKQPLIQQRNNGIAIQCETQATSHPNKGKQSSLNSALIELTRAKTTIEKAPKSANISHQKQNNSKLSQELFASSFPELVRPLHLRVPTSQFALNNRQQALDQRPDFLNQSSNIEDTKEKPQDTRSKSLSRNLLPASGTGRLMHDSQVKTHSQMLHPIPTLSKVTPVTQNTGETQISDSISPVKRARSPILVPQSARHNAFTLIPQKISNTSTSKQQLSSREDTNQNSSGTYPPSDDRKGEGRFNWRSKDGRIIDVAKNQQEGDVRKGRPRQKEVKEVVVGARRNSSQSPFDFNYRNCQRMQSDLKKSKTLLQKQDSSNLFMVTTHQSRDLSEENFTAQSAYQNKLSFKQKTEPMGRKSFLKSVHENSRKVQKDLLKKKRSVGLLNLSAFVANDKQYFNNGTNASSPGTAQQSVNKKDRLFTHRNTLSLRQALITSEMTTPREAFEGSKDNPGDAATPVTQTGLKQNKSFDTRLQSEKVHAKSFIVNSSELKVVQTSTLPSSFQRSRSNNQRLKNQFKYLTPKVMGAEQTNDANRDSGDTAQRPTVSNFQGTSIKKRQQTTLVEPASRQIQSFFWHPQGQQADQSRKQDNIFQKGQRKTPGQYSSLSQKEPAAKMTDYSSIQHFESNSSSHRISLASNRAQQPNVSYSKTNNLKKQDTSLLQMYKNSEVASAGPKQHHTQEKQGSLSFVQLMKHQKEKIVTEFNRQYDVVAEKKAPQVKEIGLEIGSCSGTQLLQAPLTQRNHSRQQILPQAAYATSRNGQTSSRSLIQAAASVGQDGVRNRLGQARSMTAGSFTASQGRSHDTRLTFFKLEAKKNRLQ